jgi:hypothetical protein
VAAADAASNRTRRDEAVHAAPTQGRLWHLLRRARLERPPQVGGLAVVAVELARQSWVRESAAVRGASARRDFLW